MFCGGSFRPVLASAGLLSLGLLINFAAPPAGAGEAPLQSSAKAEAFKTITTSGDRSTALTESEATDAEIELIRRAAADPLAKPQSVRPRTIQAASDEVQPTRPREVRRAAASTTSLPDTTATFWPAAPVEAATPAKEAPKDETADLATEQPAKAPARAVVSKAVAPGVPAATALTWLKHGNERFWKRHFRADGRGAADRARLVPQQRPHAILLSCADSRVPPETVFDQALGEVFVVRSLGEALDSAVVGSIEYAVEHFSPQLIVVLGHTNCGAVDAVLTLKDGVSAGSPDLDKMLADIRPRLKSIRSEKPSPGLEIESALNADAAARELIRRSEIVRARVEAGTLVVKSALYRLDSGKVNFY